MFLPSTKNLSDTALIKKILSKPFPDYLSVCDVPIVTDYKSWEMLYNDDNIKMKNGTAKNSSVLLTALVYGFTMMRKFTTVIYAGAAPGASIEWVFNNYHVEDIHFYLIDAGTVHVNWDPASTATQLLTRSKNVTLISDYITKGCITGDKIKTMFSGSPHQFDFDPTTTIFISDIRCDLSKLNDKASLDANEVIVGRDTTLSQDVATEMRCTAFLKFRVPYNVASFSAIPGTLLGRPYGSTRSNETTMFCPPHVLSQRIMMNQTAYSNKVFNFNLAIKQFNEEIDWNDSCFEKLIYEVRSRVNVAFKSLGKQVQYLANPISKLPCSHYYRRHCLSFTAIAALIKVSKPPYAIIGGRGQELACDLAKRKLKHTVLYDNKVSECLRSNSPLSKFVELTACPAVEDILSSSVTLIFDLHIPNDDIVTATLTSLKDDHHVKHVIIKYNYVHEVSKWSHRVAKAFGLSRKDNCVIRVINLDDD